jgi:hypothetical protein
VQEGLTLASDDWKSFAVGACKHVSVVAPTSKHLDGSSHKGSVMVFINARWEFNIQGEPSFLGQHVRVSLSIGGAHFTAISSHLPTRKFSAAAYSASLAQLDLLWPSNRNTHLLWGVDGNTALEREKSVCGPGGAFEGSGRCELFRQFAMAHRIFPASCSQRPEPVVTMVGDMGQHSKLRDYMFFSDSDKTTCAEGGSDARASGVSDHLPTFAVLRADQVWQRLCSRLSNHGG